MQRMVDLKPGETPDVEGYWHFRVWYCIELFKPPADVYIAPCLTHEQAMRSVSDQVAGTGIILTLGKVRDGITVPERVASTNPAPNPQHLAEQRVDALKQAEAWQQSASRLERKLLKAEADRDKAARHAQYADLGASRLQLLLEGVRRLYPLGELAELIDGELCHYRPSVCAASPARHLVIDIGVELDRTAERFQALGQAPKKPGRFRL